MNNDFFLEWTINGDTIAFNITLSNYNSWVGLGWHEVNSSFNCMTRSDIAIGVFDTNGKLTVGDYYAMGVGMPTLDVNQTPPGVDDIIEFSGYQSTSPLRTVVSFSKKLNSNDILYDRNITADSLKIIWAIGQGNALTDGHGQTKSQIVFNFFEPPPSTSGTTSPTSGTTSPTSGTTSPTSGTTSSTSDTTTSTSGTTGESPLGTSGGKRSTYFYLSVTISGIILVAIIANAVAFAVALQRKGTAGYETIKDEKASIQSI